MLMATQESKYSMFHVWSTYSTPRSCSSQQEFEEEIDYRQILTTYNVHAF